MQDGSRERYDPITLSSEVYLNKSVVSKTLAKLEADGILQRILGKHTIRLEFPELHFRGRLKSEKKTWIACNV
jgi:hypothetical protein